MLAVIAALVAGLAVPCIIAAAAQPPPDRVRQRLALGENPFPLALRRPPAAPLSAVARIGEAIFHDARLSASGKQSCSSCHSPDRAYGPPAKAAVAMGGPTLSLPGVRAVPSLMYLERQPAFSVGPDSGETEDTTLVRTIAQSQGAPRGTKTAGDPAAAAANLVPQGGLFWDGRADTLQDQAIGPLLNPIEMANASAGEVARKLLGRPYIGQLAQIFGPGVLRDPRMLVSEAMFAVGRYQVEQASFHPYASKFDAWLEGKARFAPAEMRGYALFNNPGKANCGGCHLDQAGGDGTPPAFTDNQFEALGAPRNTALPANRDSGYFDLGICGPLRGDMRDQTQYCGMFLTPTLRNVATRSAFFHNGVFQTLQQVIDFYSFRDVAPEKIYPRGKDGRVEKYNDIPAQYRANVDTADPPLDRQPGDKPAMTAEDEADIIAFLKTLTDGYHPPLETGTVTLDSRQDAPQHGGR